MLKTKKQKWILFIALGALVTALINPALSKKTPTLKLNVETPFFSPNGDGVQDKIVLNPTVKHAKKIKSWEIEFVDLSGNVRKTIGQEKSTPEQITWTGHDDYKSPMPEGRYEASLTIWDKKNNAYSSPPVVIVLDLTPPTISLSTVEKDIIVEDKIVSPIQLDFSAVDLSGISKWDISFMGSDGKKFFTQSSTEPLPASWTLTQEQTEIPMGKITSILSVTDRAGNQTRSNPLRINVGEGTMTPDARKPAKKYTGKFLQLTSFIAISDLFGNGADSNSSLLPRAAILLDTIGDSLVNSPGSKATVLGHVDEQSTGRLEKSLSSYFAWRVYSYLVRQKGVDKNAVSVKGLGAQVPISDNRTARGRSRNRRIEIQVFLPAVPTTP